MSSSTSKFGTFNPTFARRSSSEGVEGVQTQRNRNYSDSHEVSLKRYRVARDDIKGEVKVGGSTLKANQQYDRNMMASLTIIEEADSLESASLSSRRRRMSSLLGAVREGPSSTTASDYEEIHSQTSSDTASLKGDRTSSQSSLPRSNESAINPTQTAEPPPEGNTLPVATHSQDEVETVTGCWSCFQRQFSTLSTSVNQSLAKTRFPSAVFITADFPGLENDGEMLVSAFPPPVINNKTLYYYSGTMYVYYIHVRESFILMLL